MASVRKRTWTSKGEKKSSWVVQWQVNGKNKAKQFDKKKEADKFRLEIEAENYAGYNRGAPAHITLADLAERYLEYRWSEQKKGNYKLLSVENYEKQVRHHLMPIFDRYKVDRFNMKISERCLEEIYASCKPATCPKLRAKYRSIIQHGVNLGWIAQNYAKQSNVLLPAHQVQRVCATEEQVLLLIEKSHVRRGCPEFQASRVKTMIALAAFAGLRIGEILGLRWEDFIEEENKIRVLRSVDQRQRVQDVKTKASVREVFCVPRLTNIIKEHRKLTPGYGYICATTAKPELPVEYSAAIQQLFRLMCYCGLAKPDKRIKFGWHAFRHFSASFMIAEGVPLPAVAKQLGHANPQTTLSIYAHALPGDNAAYEALSRMGASAT